MKCKHYYTSFNPNTPRGCRLFGFESQVMPFVLVKQSTGADCSEFSPRQNNGGDDDKKKSSFSDPKYWD